MRQNSYYRYARRLNKAARITAKKYNDLEKSKALKGGEKRVLRIKKQDLIDQILFNNLKVGDNLRAFGRPDMIVEKKNVKTIKAAGCTWSLINLQNL